MSKKYYCAKCGIELNINQKAVPHEGRVIYLILPHICEETSFSDLDIDKSKKDFKTLSGKNEIEIDKKVNKTLNSLPFVSKINKATAEYESASKLQKAGDKRNKLHVRQELPTSSAPLSVLDVARNK